MGRNIPEVAGDTADELAPQVADLLHSVTHRLRREARSGLGPHDATWTQMRALRALERLPAHARMSDLADELHIARRSATSLVDDLESRGFARRGRDPHDRRAVTVETTAAGRRSVAEAGERRRRATVGMFGALPEADLRTLRDILGRLVVPRSDAG